MSTYEIGRIIRARRETLGMSQEDLADGICAVTTLSRIENGERMPSRNHVEALMQRLGYSASSVDYYTDSKNFQVYELRFKVREAIFTDDSTLAKDYLEQLEGIYNPENILDRQAVMLKTAILQDGRFGLDEKIALLEDAMRLTCPNYSTEWTPKILSYEEIVILNNIATSYAEKGELALACKLLYLLRDYYDNHVISLEEALRTQPLILYNLSKYLGLSGRYDECVEICDQGIRQARRTGRCSLLAETLFNRGWSLLYRDWPGDRKAAKECIKEAIQFAYVMRKPEQEQMEEFFIAQFGEEP